MQQHHTDSTANARMPVRLSICFIKPQPARRDHDNPTASERRGYPETATALPGWCRVVQIQQQRLLTHSINPTPGATGRCY
jgi:hypothetical protein